MPTRSGWQEQLEGVLCWAAPAAVPLSLTDRGTLLTAGAELAVSPGGCAPPRDPCPQWCRNAAPPAPQAALITTSTTSGSSGSCSPPAASPAPCIPAGGIASTRDARIPGASHRCVSERLPFCSACTIRGAGTPIRPPCILTAAAPSPLERPPSPPAAAPAHPVARCGGCGAGARGRGEGRGRPQRRAGPGGRCVARGPQAVPPGAVPAGAARAPPARAAGSCGPRRRRTERSGAAAPHVPARQQQVGAAASSAGRAGPGCGAVVRGGCSRARGSTAGDTAGTGAADVKRARCSGRCRLG